MGDKKKELKRTDSCSARGCRCKETIIKLKQENLYLQKQLNLKEEDIIDDLKNIKKELKKIEINDNILVKGGHIFKTQDNTVDNDLFFIDLLIGFYDEVIEYVNLGREYEENGDEKNLEYILYKILDTYQENRETLGYYISEKRINYIDKIVSFCQNGDMNDMEKIEYFYNKIYYEIFIEFLGNYSFSA